MNTDEEKKLEAFAKDYLNKRGVTPETAKSAGLEVGTPEQCARELGRPKPVEGGGFIIPYPGLGAKYARVRLAEPALHGGARFLSPKAKAVPVFDVRAKFGLESEPIVYVVEGPVKALALLQRGFAAVALGGVSTTLETGDPPRLNATWRAVLEHKPEVRVVFDGNVRTKPEVALALGRLVAALKAEGVSVSVVLLPEGEEGGPDDFLMKEGDAALADLLAKAVPADPRSWVDALKTPDEAHSLLSTLAFLGVLRYADLGTRSATKARLKTNGVSTRDLDRALRDLGTSETDLHCAEDPADEVRRVSYAYEDGSLVEIRGGTKTAVADMRLEIVAERVYLDDERIRDFVIEATSKEGVRLGAGVLPAGQTHFPTWHLGLFGTRALAYRGGFALFTAVQQVSPTPDIQHAARRLGFERYKDRDVFLHAGGAIGARDIVVTLPSFFKNYVFDMKERPTAEDAALALRMLDVAPIEIGATLLGVAGLCLVFDIVKPRFSVLLEGETGNFKTALSVALLNLFGTFDDEENPASATSTLPAREVILNQAGNVPMLLDDFVRRDAGRDAGGDSIRSLMQSAGNAGSRAKLDIQHNLADARPHRTIPIVTAEHVPDGASALARTLVLTFRKGTVDASILTELQENATRMNRVGRTLVEFVTAHRPSLRNVLRSRLRDLRKIFRGVEWRAHSRMPDQLAFVTLGCEVVFEALVHARLLSRDAAKAQFARVVEGLPTLASLQSTTRRDADPVVSFLALLLEWVDSGKLPSRGSTNNHFAHDAIGLLESKGGIALLNPRQAHHTYADKFRKQGAPVPITERELFRSLLDRGIVIPGDDPKNHPWTRQTTVGTNRPRLVHLHIQAARDAVAVNQATISPPKVDLGMGQMDGLRRDAWNLASYVTVESDTYVSIADELGETPVRIGKALEQELDARGPFRRVIGYFVPKDRHVLAQAPNPPTELRAVAHALGIVASDESVAAARMGITGKSGSHLTEELAAQLARKAREHRLERLVEIESLAAHELAHIGKAGLRLDLAGATEAALDLECKRDAALRLAQSRTGLGRDIILANTDTGSSTLRSHLSGVLNEDPATDLKHLLAIAENDPRFSDLRDARLAHFRYVELTTLVGELADDGRIYPLLDWVGTNTGRVSSPHSIILSASKDARRLIVPEHDHVFVAVDYNAAEPRIAAALSRDAKLLGVFGTNRDIYVSLMAKFWAVDPSRIGAFERSIGKALLIPALYGAGAEGLRDSAAAEGLPLDRADAAHFLEVLRQEFPDLADWQGRLTSDPDNVRSKLGRIPPPESLASSPQRANFPIQATGAEILKVGLTLVGPRLRALGARAHLTTSSRG